MKDKVKTISIRKGRACGLHALLFVTASRLDFTQIGLLFRHNHLFISPTGLYNKSRERQACLDKYCEHEILNQSNSQGGEQALRRTLFATAVASMLLVSACGQVGSTNTKTKHPQNNTVVSSNTTTSAANNASFASNEIAAGKNQSTGISTNPVNNLVQSNPSTSTNTISGEGASQPAGSVEVVQLSNATRSWWYTPNSSHETPKIPADTKLWLAQYGGYYVGDTGISHKSIYLTFDEGYENGYTSKILDVLKSQNVHAAFFVTASYIRKNPALIQRMVDEGHLVGNHSSTHPSMPSLANDSAAFHQEFADTEQAYKSITGQTMPKFFRPPMGEYSATTLYLTQQLGYKSIFWSFAHRDWETDHQPPVSVTHDRVVNGAHPGAIVLLHAVSQSDTDALSSIVADLRAQGYTFQTLWNM